MYNFENYTLVVYETPEELHQDIPERRFVAFLKEIPEASLHEYGSSQEEAIQKLTEEFGAFQEEYAGKNIQLPRPENHADSYSGKTVLRMPSWLLSDDPNLPMPGSGSKSS